MADGHPVACVGFFHGAMLEDPSGLLEGDGKRMRHVKLRWGKGWMRRRLGS